MRASRAASLRRPRSRCARERRLGRTLASMAARGGDLGPAPSATPRSRAARTPRGLEAGPGRACRARALSAGRRAAWDPRPGPRASAGGRDQRPSARPPGARPMAIGGLRRVAGRGGRPGSWALDS